MNIELPTIVLIKWSLGKSGWLNNWIGEAKLKGDINITVCVCLFCAHFEIQSEFKRFIPRFIQWERMRKNNFFQWGRMRKNDFFSMRKNSKEWFFVSEEECVKTFFSVRKFLKKRFFSVRKNAKKWFFQWKSEIQCW